MMLREMFLLLLSPMALGQRTLRGTEVKVTTVTSRPFIMPNNHSSGESLRYEGFLVDMLEELSTMLGFTFTIHENPNWSLISEVMNGAADIALADVVITAKSDEETLPDQATHPADPNSPTQLLWEVREESVDFTHPFMSVGLGVLGFKGLAPTSLQQLADDDSVKVGTFCCGSTARGLNKSSDPILQRIWTKMQEDPDNHMTYSTVEGINKVLSSRGDYAFILSSDLIDYKVARDCRLTQVGKTFLPHGYGLAVAPGSPFREELNKGILKMQEFGRMEMLYKKWISLPGSECASQQDGLIGWLSGML